MLFFKFFNVVCKACVKSGPEFTMAHCLLVGLGRCTSVYAQHDQKVYLNAVVRGYANTSYIVLAHGGPKKTHP